jgi:hypothetical protein
MEILEKIPCYQALVLNLPCTTFITTVASYIYEQKVETARALTVVGF